MSTEKYNETKKRILVICNYYLPGYKSGGSLRTIVNTIERFKDKFDFSVITFDHDGDRIRYETVKINEWNNINGIQVFYLSKDKITFSELRKLILNSCADSIYLNSSFSTLSLMTLVLRKLKLIPYLPVILAPEGELAEGALQLKSAKKNVFIKFAKVTQLYKDIIWKATAEPEKQEIRKIKGSGGTILIAPNMPARHLFENYNQDSKPVKIVGEAKMVFLSRYMRTKNLKWLLENVSGVKGKLTIDIFGPIEDFTYWKESQKTIKKLPENIKVEYKGAVKHNEVVAKLFEYHFFILPTLGENFGHVFIEALSAGCPLVISDRTPWHNLEKKHIGWDLPLEKPHQWVEVVNECISYNQATYTISSSNARMFAKNWLEDPKVEEKTLEVLQYSLTNTLNKRL